MLAMAESEKTSQSDDKRRKSLDSLSEEEQIAMAIAESEREAKQLHELELQAAATATAAAPDPEPSAKRRKVETGSDSGQAAPAESASNDQSGAEANSNAKYKIRAIVCHLGDRPGAGHCTAWVRKELEGGSSAWVCYNDSSRSEFLELPRYVLSQAYIVLYTRVGWDEEPAALTEQF